MATFSAFVICLCCCILFTLAFGADVILTPVKKNEIEAALVVIQARN